MIGIITINNFNFWTISFGISFDINLSYNEAKEIVKNLNITTQIEYNKRYKEGMGLPSNGLYKKDWINWYEFLGKEIRKKN